MSADKKKCPSERAVDKFEAEGPYTFKEALRVASICDRHSEKEGRQAGDSIDIIIRKFPPQEFSMLLNPKAHCNPEQLKAWKSGTDDWKYKHLHKGVTDAQLIQIASNRCFTDVMENTEWEKVSVEGRLAILREIKRDRIREQKRRHEQKRAKAVTRDASQTRQQNGSTE